MGVRGRLLLDGYMFGVLVALVAGLLSGADGPDGQLGTMMIICSVVPAIACTLVGLAVWLSRPSLDVAIVGKGFWAAGWLAWAAWWWIATVYFWVYRDAASILDGPQWALSLPLAGGLVLVVADWLDRRAAPTLGRLYHVSNATTIAPSGV